MTRMEALKILKPTGDSKDDVKSAYRAACFKYHPDKGGDPEIMKLVNLAWETLCEFGFSSFERKEAFSDSGPSIVDEIMPIWNKLKTIPGVVGEVCGTWIWVTGETKHVRAMLKEMGFSWAGKKQAWYWKPSDSWKSKGKNYSMEAIRGMWGSKTLEKEESQAFGLH